MTQQNTTNHQDTSARPTHNLRMKTGYGQDTSYETIGVAWEREDGGLYIKLHGTQIIRSGFYAVPIKQDA